MILSDILKEKEKTYEIPPAPYRTIEIRNHKLELTIVKYDVIMTFKQYDSLMKDVIDGRTVWVDGKKAMVVYTRGKCLIGDIIKIDEIRYDCV